MSKKNDGNPDFSHLYLNPGDIVIKHWDDSSGKPVKTSEHIISGDASAAELLRALLYQ